jgi:uncharacterized protein YjbJ (UPF0337 family)
MDRNTAKGKARRMMGAAMQKTGEITGNSELELKGAVQRLKGAAQEGLGRAKEFEERARAELQREMSSARSSAPRR